MSLALSLLAATVCANDPAVSKETKSEPVALAALKVGGLFPQVMSTLDTSFVVGVEGAWVTPLFGHKLALSAELSFSQPTESRTVTDPRVPTGSYSYVAMERTLGLYFGPKYFFLPPGGKLVPYLSLGVRAQFIDSQIVASADQPFGQHDETGTHFAFGGHAGIGYRLGPGLIALELQLVSSPLDHLVTGKVNVGDLAVRAAYVLTF